MRDDATVALNRKPRREFTIDDTFEAGLVSGRRPIKSIRAGKAEHQQPLCPHRARRGVAHRRRHRALRGQGNRYNHDPKRTRKLLEDSKQMDELLGRAKAKGQTIVPLRLYISPRGKAKVELGLARGKQLHQPKRDIADRDAKRDIARQLADFAARAEARS